MFEPHRKKIDLLEHANTESQIDLRIDKADIYLENISEIQGRNDVSRMSLPQNRFAKTVVSSRSPNDVPPPESQRYISIVPPGAKTMFPLILFIDTSLSFDTVLSLDTVLPFDPYLMKMFFSFFLFLF